MGLSLPRSATIQRSQKFGGADGLVSSFTQLAATSDTSKVSVVRALRSLGMLTAFYRAVTSCRYIQPTDSAQSLEDA
jgi:hypothetical protein